MSDTQKLILWIVLAVVVIAIVAWLLVRSSRKRQEEEQRRQARSLRAQAAARNASVTRAKDRASVTQQIASEARAEAEQTQAEAQQALEEAKARAAEAQQQAARAERLDQEAQSHQSSAGQVQSDRDDLLREADRVDPDVPTDERGQRVDDSARRGDPGAEGVAHTDDSLAGPRARDERAADETAAASFGDKTTAEVPAPDEMRRPAGSADAGVRAEATDGTRPERHDEAQRPSAWPGAVGVGSAVGAVAAGGISAATFEDDEPDLADAENPFAAPKTHGVASEPAAGHGLHEGSGDQDRSQESRHDDELRDADAGAGDTRGTRPVAPVQGEDANTGERMTPSGPTGPADPHDRPGGDLFASRPEFGDPTDSGHVTGTKGAEQASEPSAVADSGDEREDDSDDDVDWVNGPVDEEAIDERPVDDVVDWINGPSDDESVTMEVPEERSSDTDHLVAAAAAGGGRDATAAGAPADEVIARMPEQPHVATPDEDEATHGDQSSEESHDDVESAGSADAAHEDEGQHLGRQEDADAGLQGRGQRRVSGYDEVRDGGYGVGSAAPIEDGAQPLGHAIKAVRGSGTYLAPGAQGYDDVEPDVWFYDEQAARNAGYRSAADH